MMDPARLETIAARLCDAAAHYDLRLQQCDELLARSDASLHRAQHLIAVLEQLQEQLRAAHLACTTEQDEPVTLCVAPHIDLDHLCPEQRHDD